ncbi:MAG TPA: serine--tRNA ligase [Candidatus Sulfotelmatobacter sp.]|nr:serine--tRNA ligase [Candidatus Sulfotelmatobacter sp.]
MLDLAYVRENLPQIEEMLRRRGMDPQNILSGFRQTDEKRRQLITQSETLKAQRNRASEEIAKLKKAGEDATSQMEQTKALRAQGDELEKQAGEIDQELRTMLAGIPNVPHESVPVGRSADDNKEVRQWGKPPEFSFTPKPHWELGEQLGILDQERAVKLSGARFAVYWDLGAKLERALANFMLDLHTSEHGYTEVLPPYMVNSASMYGTGQLPKFANDLFKIENHDLWLIPTAEVPLTNLYRDEVIDAARLPLSVTGYTPCFRSEAGSYGKDVRGIIRQHQFQKVELVKFARPRESYEQHDRLTRDAEMVLQKLGLHYRVMLLCTGDMGPISAKTYDLEVWLPGQQLYREISSCSNFEAYQARRANIRWRPEGGKKTEFVHTLNGSGLAIGRTWLAILENYQQADGSVIIPEALRKYVGEEKITAKKF